MRDFWDKWINTKGSKRMTRPDMLIHHQIKNFSIIIDSSFSPSVG